MIWHVPEGWSEKRARKEAEKQAAVFERQCREGYLTDGRQTFAQYAEYVMELERAHGPETPDTGPLPAELETVLPFLGHLRLGRSAPSA